VTHAAAPAAFPSVPHMPHVAHALKRLLPGIFQDQVQITYASTLIAANVNPKVIQARLGHATITETMDTYGHLFPDSEDIGRGAIDAMLASADVRQMCATEGS